MSDRRVARKEKMNKLCVSFVTMSVACCAMAKMPLYTVIDLSAGSAADKYSVRYLDEIPQGGWTDVHKTTSIVLRYVGEGSNTLTDGTVVSVSRPYYIGVFEVTQKQYELVTGENPSGGLGDSRPVNVVSYDDLTKAGGFIDLLSHRTALTVRLPALNEWEYACRAGRQDDYWGHEIGEVGRYSGNCGDGKGGYNNSQTTVGSYLANVWGVYDMIGNVWEWCADATLDGNSHYAAGGNYNFGVADCKPSSKIPVANDGAYLDGGFRVCITAEPEPLIYDVLARQRYPWNGKVDISYKASGIESAAPRAGWLTSLKVTATDKQSGTTYTATSLNGDTSVTDGVHVAVWDMSAQGLSFKSTNVVFDVTCEVELGGVQLWENGPYWAECNVGASKPEECGYYFWWGDTVGYKRNASNNGWISVKDGASYKFIPQNCPPHYKSDSELRVAGYIDSTDNLVAAHDAATAHLGAPWRMPTDAEFAALINNCTTTWTMTNGVYGCLVTGKGAYALKCIFLPAAGYGDSSYLINSGSSGSYWSTTKYSDRYSLAAWCLVVSSSYFDRNYTNRCYGRSVRPVRGFVQ